MGGNRKGKVLSFLFILITMFIGGLWHGASWNFVIWGLFHGILIIINHTLNLVFKEKNTNFLSKLRNFFKMIFTFVLVSFGWVIFKLNSIDSIKIFFNGIFGRNGLFLNLNFARFFENNNIIDYINIEFKNIFYYGTSQIYFLIFGLIIVFILPNTHELMKNFKIVLPFKNPTKSQNTISRITFEASTGWALFIAFIAVCAITGVSNNVKEFIYYQF